MKNPNKKKLIIAIIIFIILFIILIVVAGIVDGGIGNVFGFDEDDYDYLSDDVTWITLYEQDYITDYNIETYLFMGTDASGNEDAEGEDYQGSMADYLALVIVDNTDKTYATLTLNRDTMTEIQMMDSDGEQYVSANMQLCTAHWYGGNKQMSCENTVTAVSDLLGELPISGYYALPMEAMTEVNRLVGGVTITITDDLTVIDPAFVKDATITLSDEQAYKFVRARRGVGDGENLSRMTRQRQYLSALYEQIKKQSAADIDFSLNLFNDLSEFATTDINGKKVSKLANKIFQYENKGIYQFEGTNEVGQALGDGVDHTEFYLDKDSVITVMKELYHLDLLDE